MWPGWETVDQIGAGGFSDVYKIRKVDGNGDFFPGVRRNIAHIRLMDMTTRA